MYKRASLSDVQWLQLCMNLIVVARVSTENYCNHILLPYSYSLYEPKSHALMEYNGGLEKAILRDSELLSEVNDAFCKSHPLLAQKVVTRSACAAVSKIGADTLVSKALSVRRAKAGSLLNTIQEVNAFKLEENDILVRHGYHTAGSLPPWPLDAVLPPPPPPPIVRHQQQQQSCPHHQQQQSCPHPHHHQQRAAPTASSSRATREEAVSQGSPNYHYHPKACDGMLYCTSIKKL